MSSRSVRFALLPFFVLLLLFLWILFTSDSQARPGRLLAADYGVYYSAAQVLEHHGDPYDHGSLVAAEDHYLRGSGTETSPPELVRVAEPPVMFWLLRPVTGLPLLATVWEALAALALVAGAGLAATAMALGWKRPIIPVLIGLAMPATSLYIHFGNAGVVVFAALGFGLFLADRYPFVAGVILSLAIWKPQIALPLAGLVLLFHSASRRRAVAGFLAGALLLLVASALTAGPSALGWWLGSFTDFASSVPEQGDIPSLAGLYVAWAPHPVSLLLSALLVLGASLATLAALCRYRRILGPLPIRSMAWLWLAWFLAVPYGHFADEVFLAPVLMSVFVCPCAKDRLTAVLLLYGALISVLVQNVHPSQTALLCLLPLAALVALIPWRRVPHELRSPRAFVMGGQATSVSS